MYLISSGIGAFAQDDKNWFQRLFQRDEEVEKPVDTGGRDSLDFLLDEYLKPDSGSTFEESSVHDPIQARKEGHITLVQSRSLEAINDSLVKNPIQLQGYRVQVFFGEIDRAKEARADYIRRHPDEKCIIEHVPPNFSVRIGDFTDEMHAYRRMKELKADYPSAIIVPGPIDVPLD